MYWNYGPGSRYGSFGLLIRPTKLVIIILYRIIFIYRLVDRQKKIRFNQIFGLQLVNLYFIILILGDPTTQHLTCSNQSQQYSTEILSFSFLEKLLENNLVHEQRPFQVHQHGPSPFLYVCRCQQHTFSIWFAYARLARFQGIPKSLIEFAGTSQTTITTIVLKICRSDRCHKRKMHGNSATSLPGPDSWEICCVCIYFIKPRNCSLQSRNSTARQHNCDYSKLSVQHKERVGRNSLTVFREMKDFCVKSRDESCYV